ncbi:MAG TPA: hypothetical protein GXX29_08855 [Firmicutes bacterium]|nr:hypothetical protein [Bacillota bacterium]
MITVMAPVLSVAGAGILTLGISLAIGICTVFFLPYRIASFIRLAGEWATGLAGPGLFALFLVISTLVVDNKQYVWSNPALLGSALTLSYIPLLVVLMLHALEPHWAVAPTGRALGLSDISLFTTMFTSAGAETGNALALAGLRITTDFLSLLLFFTWCDHFRFAIPLVVTALVLSAVLFARHLTRLVQLTGAPANPPHFCPLPETPPRLGIRFHLRGLLCGVLAAMLLLWLIVLFLGCIFGKTVEGLSGSFVFPNLHPVLSLLLLFLAAGALLFFLRGPKMNNMNKEQDFFPKIFLDKFLLVPAGLSPVLFAALVVALMPGPWFLWLPAVAGSICLYVIIQVMAAHQVNLMVGEAALVPGENTMAGAARALGLPLSDPQGFINDVCQALSAAAAWSGAAALLEICAAVGAAGAAASLPVGRIFFWLTAAAFLHVLSLWVRSTWPRPTMAWSADFLSIGQEEVT